MIFKKTKKDIKTYNLTDWFDSVSKLIDKKIIKSKGTIVILVAWGTASWKTSAVAKKINDFYPDSQLLSMDNYYRGPSFMKEHPEYNFDQPEVLNLDLFYKHLKELKNWKDVKIPSFDFKNDPVMDAIKIKASKIIIVEWLFALDDKLSKLWDVKVFVDLGVHSQILRRLFRDVERTWDKANDILKYFLEVVGPMHKKYILPTKNNADLVLINDYIPDLESRNAKIKETKVRYRVNQKDIKESLSEIVYKLWWIYVWKLEETDYFFDPTGNYKKSWEILKVQKVWFNRYFFSYLWPEFEDNDYEDRYSMKFFLDYTTLQSFRELFPNNVHEISKLRRTFYVSWVLVCLDELENGDTFVLFKFEESYWKTIISDILKHLKIDARTGLKKSYIDLMNK